MVTLLDPRVWLAVAVIAGGAFTFGYYKGHQAGTASARAAQQEEVDKWRTNADAAAELYEAERAKKAPAVRTVYRTKEVIRAKNPDFDNCRTGADGLRALSDRIAIANTGQPAPAVPAVAKPGK